MAFNKKNIKNIVAFIISIDFACLSAYTLLTDHNLPLAMIIISWVGIIFFGIGGLFAGYMMFGPKKVAPVDWNQHYLCINYGLYHREIEWKHITGFSVKEYQDIDWVLVHVDNTDEVIASTSNWYKRWSLKLTYKTYGALFAIQAERLIQTPQQLCEQLESELAKHKSTYGANI